MESSFISGLVSRLLELDADAAWHVAGWTMLHFLWVGGLVAIIAGVLRLAFRRTRCHARYLTALIMLALLAASPVAIAAWLVPAPREGISDFGYENSDRQAQGPDSLTAAEAGSRVPEGPLPRSDAPGATAPVPITDPVPAAQPHHSGFPIWHAALDSVVSALPYIWLAGAPCMLLLLATGLTGGAKLRRRSRMLGDGAVVDVLERLRQNVRGRAVRRLAVAACDRVRSPVLVGIVRPLVLFPPAALTGWTPEQIEMVLLHELAHVRRWDNLVNLLQRLVESLLFFHPAVWWLSGWVRQEREHCCDAFVVRSLERQGRQTSRRSYARLLLDLAAADRTRPLAVPGAAFAARDLRSRIRHILTMEEQPMRVSLKPFLAVLAVATLLVALTASAALGLVDLKEHVGESSAETGVTEDLAVRDAADTGTQGTDSESPGNHIATDASLGEEPGGPEESLEHRYQSTVAAWDLSSAEFVLQAQKHGSARQLARVNISLARWKDSFAKRRQLLRELDNARLVYEELLLDESKSGIFQLVKNRVSQNPAAQQYQMQMLWLDAQIVRHKTNSGNRRSAALARLEELKRELAQKIEQIEDAERERSLHELQESPDLLHKLARKQYEAQVRVLRAQIAELDATEKEIVGDLQEIARQHEKLAERLKELVCLAERIKEILRDIEQSESVPVGPGDEPIDDDSHSGGTPSGDDVAGKDSAAAETDQDRPKLTYDGKGFDYWKDAWRTELKAERRTEIIRALAAFGAQGYGREAAETIFDIVEPYHGFFGGGRIDAPERELVEAAEAALAGEGIHVPYEDMVAVLAERIKESPRLAVFAASVVGHPPHDAVAAFPHILELSITSPDDNLVLTTLAKMQYMYPHLPVEAKEKVVLRLREALKSPDYLLADRALGALYPVTYGSYGVRGAQAPPPDIRAGYVPELLDTLRHPDLRIREEAMLALRELGAEAKPSVPTLVEMVNAQQALAALAGLAAKGTLHTSADYELRRTAVEQLQVMNTLRSLQAAPDEVMEFYEGAESVVPKLLDLLTEDGVSRIGRAAIAETLRHMTGSHEVAEEYLRDVIETRPRSSEAAHAKGSLQQIEYLRRRNGGVEDGADGRGSPEHE